MRLLKSLVLENGSDVPRTRLRDASPIVHARSGSLPNGCEVATSAGLIDPRKVRADIAVLDNGDAARVATLRHIRSIL